MATREHSPPTARDTPPQRGPLPSDWSRQVGWVLLPLRAFLGFTFVYAGLSKIADPSFLDDSDPTSLHSTIVAVRGGSPIGSMLGPIESHATLFGVIIAIGETAIGLGLLTGLLTRIAAAGGIVLSLGLWLTVSWNAEPWYTGADLAYAFALSPLLLGGAGGVLALDAWLADVTARHAGEPGGTASADRTRRGLLAVALGLTGLVAIGGAALVRSGRTSAAEADDAAAGGTTEPATPSPSAPASSTAASAAPTDSATATSAAPAPSPAATGAVVAKTADVAVGGAKLVRNPSSGEDDLWVMQLESGQFTALDGVCPHQGCVVAFRNASNGFVCPCHDSRFTSAGARISGPATTGLERIAVVVSGDQVHLA